MGVPVRDVAVALQTWGVIRAYRPQPGCLPVSLQKRMQQIMAHCFLAAKSKLECKLGYFDLIGCDFLIDDNFKVLSSYAAGTDLHPLLRAAPQARASDPQSFSGQTGERGYRKEAISQSHLAK